MQLKWLEDTLRQMEKDGEIAIVISHHPPGDNSCLYQWSIRYRALMDRFQHIVRFSFHGHVHLELHNSIRSFEDDKPIGNQYWTGAASTYSEIYPTFRRFIVDEQTMLPVAIETYLLNITQENPEFELDHELTQYYGMSDLSPESYDKLSDQFLNDEELAIKYINT